MEREKSGSVGAGRGCLVLKASQSRRDMGPHMWLTAWWRVEWDGFLIASAEYSLFLVPVKRVVIALWKRSCLREP